ncbi:MAG TPA: Rnase Y domain-containing protein, partial [Tepidisphaeraceae bacterium]|nr:Rnase Y domain-containing protein [Tepidisphaeraceae bacterium]
MVAYLIGGLAGLLLGAVSVFLFIKFSSTNLVKLAKQAADQTRENAKREAETRVREVEVKAKQDHMAIKEAFEKEVEGQRRKLADAEMRITKREDTFDRKLDTLTIKERNLDDREVTMKKRETKLTERETELAGVLEEQKQRLLSISGLSVDQAKQILLERVEADMRIEAGEIIRRHTEAATEEGKEKARQIILGAIQRYAAEQTADHTVSTVAIPDD